MELACNKKIDLADRNGQRSRMQDNKKEAIWIKCIELEETTKQSEEEHNIMANVFEICVKRQLCKSSVVQY